MEIQQLRYIVSLCRYKNFTRVAETLFVSQSAVSQQIKKIEQELGVCLFSRSTHGMMPTPAGSELYRYAQTVLDAYDQFMDASRCLTEQGENTIKVFALNKLKVVGLPAALMEFHNSHPDIVLEFVNQSMIRMKMFCPKIIGMWPLFVRPIANHIEIHLNIAVNSF